MPKSSGFRNTYQSQFVPLPLEAFARANEKNQAVQDNQVAQATDTSDALWKISPFDANDKEYTDTLRKGFDEVAQVLTTKDLTQKENQDEVKTLIKNTTRDPTLNHILSVNSERAQYEKNKAEMIKNNTYHPFNDVAGMSFDDYSKNGGYKSGKSVTSNIFKYEDSEPVRKQYFDDLQKLGSETIHHINDQWYKNGIEGIPEARIGKQAHAAISSYMATPAAAQDGREYDFMVRNSNPKNLTKDGQLKDAKGKTITKDAYILDKFITTGMERAGMSTTTGRAAALTADAKEKKEAVNLFAGLASNEIPSTLLDGLEVKFENGNIKGDGKGIFANIKESMAAGNYNPIDIYTKWKNDSRLSDEQNTRLKSVIVGAKLSGVSDEKYIEHFNKTWAPVIPEPLTGAALTNNNNAFMNGGAGLWPHMIVSKDGVGSMGLLEALEKEFDNVPDPKTAPEEFTEFLKNNKVQVTGAYAPNKLSAKPIEITINGTTFAADLTNGGKNMQVFKSAKEREEAMTAHNLAKLNAGEQVEELDSAGNTVIYFKNLSKFDKKTGDYKVDHKIIPKK